MLTSSKISFICNFIMSVPSVADILHESDRNRLRTALARCMEDELHKIKQERNNQGS